MERSGEETQDGLVYSELARLAEVHFSESKLGRFVGVSEYDPERETHNFHNTFFEARPNTLTPHALTVLGSAIIQKSPRYISQRAVEPFKNVTEEAAAIREHGKLAIITGHQNVFEPVFATFGLQRSLSRETDESYTDIAKNTHLIAARALACVDVLGRLSLNDIARQMMNIYYTFPRTANYRGENSHIPMELQDRNNRQMLGEFLSNTRAAGSLVALSSVSTNEKQNSDGVNVVPRVAKGTIKLLQKGWHVLPVGGNFSRSNLTVIPGDIIPPEEVTPVSIHGAMEDVVVASRNMLGVPSLYENDEILSTADYKP